MPTTPAILDRKGLVVTSAPATEPVTTAEAKLHLRVDASDDDTMIGAMVTAARRWVERVGLFRTLVTTTYRMALDSFPASSRCIELPLPPLQSVSSITYVDTAGTTQTLSSSLYRVAVTHAPGFVEPAYGYSWPSTRDVAEAVNITFVAGYGAASAVPEEIKTAIKLIVEKLYDRWKSSGGEDAAFDDNIGGAAVALLSAETLRLSFA